MQVVVDIEMQVVVDIEIVVLKFFDYLSVCEPPRSPGASPAQNYSCQSVPWVSGLCTEQY